MLYMQKTHVDEVFIEKTKLVWQNEVAPLLSKQDALDIIENTVGFFSLLMEWEQRSNG